MDHLGGIKHQGLIGIPLANSSSQTIHRMVLDLADALKEKGFTPKLFDPFSGADWANLSSQGISSVICYGIGISQALDMVSFLHGINTILVCLDHPVHGMGTFRNFKMRHVGRAVYTFPTQSNLAFAKDFLGDVELRCLRHSAKAVNVIPADLRSGRIVFVGNYTPEDSIRSLVGQQEPTLLPAFDGAVKRLCARDATSLEDAVAPFVKDVRGSTTTQFHWLCVQVDLYMRALVRRRALDSLQGLPVDLIGDGWNAVPLHPSIRLLGCRDSPDALEIVRNASIVINSTPYYNESHERMFEAAAAGTAIVTARNDHTNRLFSDCGSLYDDEAEIGGLCAALLSDPSALENKGLNGIRLIQDHEGWSHRIDEIADMLAPKEKTKSIHKLYDMIINLREKTQSLDLSMHKLSTAANIIISIMPDQVLDAVQFLNQTGGFFRQDARISILVDGVVPISGFFQLSLFLEQNGYQTVDVAHSPTNGSITIQKCVELDEEDRRCAFNVRNKDFILTYPSSRDILRRYPLHFKTFYELPLLQYIETIEKPGLFIDVGANIGNHSVYAAGILGRTVIAYEPNPSTFACLRANITANALELRIDARCAGVGKASGHAQVGRIDPANSGATRLELHEAGEIRLVCLDDELLSFTKRVAILKIDVEGMELDVLQGAERLLKAHQPVVFAETWSDEATANLTMLMASYDYTCTGKITGTAMLEFRPQNP